MFSFKTINKNKSNYKGCCLWLLKGFSTLVKTSFANLIASVIPVASKPLIMESFSFLRWLYESTIHLAWRGFKSLNLRDTFTSPGAIPFNNCLVTLLAYDLLNLFKMNFFCFLISAYIQGLKLIGKTARNDNQFTFIILFAWQIRKDDDIEKIFALF